MSLMLGINAGGTYTDAVLFDKKSAKSLTTKHNLTVGITNACNEVLEGTPLLLCLWLTPKHQSLIRQHNPDGAICKNSS